MNQFTLNLQPSDTLWYSPTPMEQQQQQPPLKTYQLFYNNNNTNSFSDIDSDNNSTTSANIETPPPATLTLDKEHMFEKPLTPSDVGKLNRLVIPKQHAEKYLPLTPSPTTTTTADGGSGGGLLLSFEDETGKSWRFRYSYWNSSQSYVLTKGWSRYVKEKKLDAGDVVLFERHRFENERFFIGWRRRGVSNPLTGNPPGWSGRSSYNFNVNYNNNNNYNYGGYNGNYGQNVVQSQQTYVVPQQMSAFSNFRPEFLPHHGTVQVRQKAKKSGSGNSKRVRLFGVNLECQLEDEDEVIEDEPQTSDGSSLSSQGHAFVSGSTMGPTAYNNFGYVGYPPNHHNNHMDMNFPHDVNNQMRNRTLG